MGYFRERASNSRENRVRSRLQFYPLILVFFAAGYLRAGAEFAGCVDCDVAFTLTHTDIQCLSKRIDRLLGRPDPVYFDAANCEPGSVAVMSSTLPPIVPPTPVAAPANKWLQLTRQQLQCLRTKLPELAASVDNPVKVSLGSSDCVGNKP